jgi:alanine dehydrogenase
MVTVLSEADVASLLDLEDLLPVIEEAFVKQGRGEVERPDRPQFPIGTGLVAEPGTGLAMPAYVHGDATFATKVASVVPANRDRGLPSVTATVLACDADTGRPRALLAGTRVTNARTGCIGGLAARELAVDGPVTLGVLGAGAQARWQTRAVAAATDLAAVRVHSPSESRAACAADLRGELGDAVDVRAVSSPREAVTGATVVVTATTSHDPVFDGRDLDPGTLVVAVGAYEAGMRELDGETMRRAARVLADVPEEVAAVGDVADAGLGGEDLHPLSAAFEGRVGRESDDEVLVVDSVGSAVLDAATAAHLVERADERGAGTEVEL